MRLALVGSAVQLPGVGKESARYNLAMGYLEAFVRDRLHSVEVQRLELPITLDRPEFPEDCVDRILACDPEVIGLSSYCWDVDAFGGILAELRRRSPGSTIVLGGPSATFDAQGLMEAHPEIDVAVRGEGEQALAELLDGGLWRLAQVPGLLYRDGELLRETAVRPPVADMADLRSPYLSGILEPPKNNLMIECSRGCLFRCKYCAWKNFLGGVRYTPSAVLEAEMAWALEHGYSHAFILDSAINFETERLAATMGSLRRSVPFGAIRFTYFLSHLFVNPEQIRLLSGVASHEIYIGLESVGEAALKTVGRPRLDKAKFEQVLDEISEIGSTTVSIILGIPGDTLEGFKETVDYLVELAHKGGRKRIAHVRVFWMIIAPGSSLAVQKAELGIVTAPRGVPYLLRSATFSEADLIGAFEFLANHPARSLFIWDDADPAGHFPGLRSLAPQEWAAARDDAPVMGPVHMSQEELLQVLPLARVGARTRLGWSVTQVTAREGWPLIRMEAGARRIEIQVRRRAEGVPAFVSTARYALSWMSAPDSPDLSGDPAVHQLLVAVAREIQRREGGA